MGKTMPANVYELVGSEYVDRGGYLDDLKLVGYSTKGGKVRKSAHNKSVFSKWAPEGPYRLYGNTTNRYDGYTTFIRCGNKADDTGFCKRHKSSAVIDGKVTSKNSVASKLLAWLPRIYKKKK